MNHPGKKKPFPEAWLSYLEQDVFLYRLLSEEQQTRLRNAVQIFIAGKFWEGCAGLKITDEIQVTVAGQACILVLGLDDYYFDELKTVLIYPGGYLGLEHDAIGGAGRAAHRLGEAHPRGPVILSWWQARWYGRRLGSRNLVLHEFAHKLAELGDPSVGRPPLHDPQQLQHWEEVMSAEYERLVEDAAYQRPTLLDHYGATSQTEFFAVASECFFLKPVALRRQHLPLYQLLASWYGQDPAERPNSKVLARQAHDADEEFARHAIEECCAALRLWPDYLDAYSQRAGLFYDLGEYNNALADYTKVIELAGNEEASDAYHDRGLVHLAAGSYDFAIADFSDAISRSPDFARAYCDRGAAQAARGEHELAIRDLTYAIRVDPRDDQPYLDRGTVYADQGKYDKAIRDFTRAIRLAPHLAQGYSDRAWARNSKHEYDQAIDDCDQAIRLDPGLAEPYKHRGVAHYRKGKHDSAIADLEQALQIDPNYVLAYRARARAYLAKGMSDEARRDLERASELESP